MSWEQDHPDEQPPAPPKSPREQAARLDPRRGLPRLPIFWTPDQIAAMLNLSELALRDSYLWFEGRDTGVYRRRYLRCVNVAKGKSGRTDDTEWRIAEPELLRWLTFHDLWLYDPFGAYIAPDPRVVRQEYRRDEPDGMINVVIPANPQE